MELSINLDELTPASPCSAMWEEMAGDDCVRECHTCGRNVYRLDDLSAVEVAELLGRKEGRSRPRLFRRPDGSVLAGDCPEALRRQFRRRMTRLAALGITAIVLMCPVSVVLQKMQTPGFPRVPSGPNANLKGWSRWLQYAFGLKDVPSWAPRVVAQNGPLG